MAYSTTRTGSTSSRRYLSGVATSSERKEPSGRGSNTGSAALCLARHNRAAPVAAAAENSGCAVKPRSARHNIPGCSAAAMDSYAVGEVTLAKRLVAALQPGMLCLADRGFTAHPLFSAAAATGAALLWRAKNNAALPVLEPLPDGSF